MQTDQLRIYFMNGIENIFTYNTILYRHSQTSILGLLHGCLSLGRGSGTEVYVPVNAPEPNFSW